MNKAIFPGVRVKASFATLFAVSLQHLFLFCQSACLPRPRLPSHLRRVTWGCRVGGVTWGSCLADHSASNTLESVCARPMPRSAE